MPLTASYALGTLHYNYTKLCLVYKTTYHSFGRCNTQGYRNLLGLGL